MIDDVAGAVRSGLSFVCAMCYHYDGKVCELSSRGILCAGPLSWMAFPHYSGPLEGHLHSVCFVCGERSDAAVVIPGAKDRMIGVCDRHVGMLETFSRPASRPAFVTHKNVPIVE